jgi:hypothetical protein
MLPGCWWYCEPSNLYLFVLLKVANVKDLLATFLECLIGKPMKHLNSADIWKRGGVCSLSRQRETSGSNCEAVAVSDLFRHDPRPHGISE